MHIQRCLHSLLLETELQQRGVGEKRFAEVAENRHSFGLDQ